MREIYKIDTNVLKTNKESILSEQKSFINYTYKTFLDGYLCNSSDSKIIEIKNKLDIIYKNIEKSYDKITNWFTNYVTEVDNLEVTLQTRTNKLVNSQTILSSINSYLNDNKVDVGMAPNIYDEMSIYIKDKKDALNEELNKIDERAAYVEKYGEEEGTRRYNQAINNIKNKEEEYDEILNSLDNLKNERNEAIDAQLQMYQDTLQLLYQTRDELETEVDQYYNEWVNAASPNAYEQFCITNGFDREDPVAIETWQNYTSNIKMNYAEKQAALDELNFIIKEYENAAKLYPYYSLCGSAEYDSFVAAYNLDPKNGLTGKDNKINQYALYESSKNQGKDLGYIGDIELTNGITINDMYKYLTDDQKNIYNYLYCTKGSEEALKFLKLLSDDINKQKGFEQAQEWINEFEYYDASFDSDNVIEVILAGMSTEGMVAVTGLKDGLDSYAEGLMNVFDSRDYMTSDEYARAFIYQYIVENASEYADVYKITSATGNILPTIVASMVTAYTLGAGSTLLPSQIDHIAGLVGKLSMGFSVYGNSMHAAKVNGLDGQAAILYSILCSGSEVLLESLLGGLPFISKEESKFILAKMFSEGREEFIQEFVGAWINAIFYGETIEYDELTEDALESFLIGGIVCGIITGGTTTVEVIIKGEKYVIDLNELSKDYMAYKKSNGTLNIFDFIKRYKFASVSTNVDNLDAISSQFLEEYKKIESKVIPKQLEKDSQYLHLLVTDSHAAAEYLATVLGGEASDYIADILSYNGMRTYINENLNLEVNSVTLENYKELEDMLITDNLKNDYRYRKLLLNSPYEAAEFLAKMYGGEASDYIGAVLAYKAMREIIDSRFQSGNYNSKEIDFILKYASTAELLDFLNNHKDYSKLKALLTKVKSNYNENDSETRLDIRDLESYLKKIDELKTNETIAFLLDTGKYIRETPNDIIVEYRGRTIYYPKESNKYSPGEIEYILNIIDEMESSGKIPKGFETIIFKPKDRLIVCASTDAESILFVNPHTTIGDDIKGTIVHEGWHLIDTADNIYSSSDEYINAARLDGNYTSDYGRSYARKNNGSLKEDFAECAYYLQSKGRTSFEKQFPHRAEYLKKYLPDYYYSFSE